MLMASAVLTSCEKSTEKMADQITARTHKEKVATDDHEKAGEHGDAAASLELNNGKKWETNAGMQPYIIEQEKLIEGYASEKGDYKTLAANLHAANEKLIKSCTMTGKSHDILHIWLTGHLKNIDLLGKTDSDEEADRLVGELEHSMATYHEYFE